MTSLTLSPTLKCGQPSCTVESTGQCLEGLPPASCPNRIEVVVSSKAESAAGTSATPLPKQVQLRSGRELSFLEAGNLLASPFVRVIAIVGDNDAGKTTLLASLFDQFCRGPYGGYNFAGSLSLQAFDRRVYLGHTRCGAANADTIRTSHAWDINFLHLRLRQASLDEAARELLISDIPGETCKRARISTDNCRQLRALLRADRLVLAIDGEKLADHKSREATASEAVQLLRRLIETSVVRHGIPVDVLVTKWDRIVSAASIEDVRATMGRVRLQLEYSPYFKGHALSIEEVAARPLNASSIPHCFGMGSIPSLWCESAKPRYRSVQRDSNSRRQMDRFVATVSIEEDPLV